MTGDFNGDGKLDLAVSSRGNDILTILLGNGDGTFTPVVGCCGTSLGLTHTLAMAIGDFNGDGNLDLVLAVQNIESLYPADYIEVFLGNGNGGFTPTDFSLLLPNDAYSFAVGDFNGDGMLDLATASQPDNYVSVLLQTPPSATPPDFSVRQRTHRYQSSRAARQPFKFKFRHSTAFSARYRLVVRARPLRHPVRSCHHQSIFSTR